MSYAEIMLESSVSPVILEQVISDAVYDACISGGKEVFEAFSMYLKILESNGEYEPKEEFEQQLDEVFTPFFENAASIYGGMLLTEDAFSAALAKAPTKASTDSQKRKDNYNKSHGTLRKLYKKGRNFARGIKSGLKRFANNTVNKSKSVISGGAAWAKNKYLDYRTRPSKAQLKRNKVIA